MKTLRNRYSPVRHLTQGLVASVAIWGAFDLSAADAITQLGDVNQGSTTPRSHAEQGTHKESAFIKEAAKGGQSEVVMGKMAVEHGQNEQIKQLGQRLDQDHSKANQELMEIAQTLGVHVPMAHKNDAAMNKIEQKTGAEFDKAFAEHALTDHIKDIRQYQQALQDVQDPKLKAFISKSIPVLRQHLELARAAGRAVGVEQRMLNAADQFLSEHGHGTVGSRPDKANRQQGLGTGPNSETGQGSSSGTSGNNRVTPTPLPNPAPAPNR